MISLCRLRPKINILRKENDAGPERPSSPSCIKNPNKNTGPLTSTHETQITFKGLSISEIKKGTAVAGKVLEASKAIKQVEKFLPEPVHLAINKAIRYYGKNVPNINIIEPPVKERFISALKSPFKATENNINYLLKPKMRKAIKEKDVSNRMIRSLESVYRETTRLRAQGKSDEEIRKIISESLTTKMDKLKPNYSMNVNSFTVRMVTGVLGAFFIATDFGNLKRMVDDDPVESRDQWIRKFRESVGAGALSAVLGYYTNTTFKQKINSSLPFAVVLTAFNAFLSDVIVRKLLGRPLLPIRPKKNIDKQNTDKQKTNSSPNSSDKKVNSDIINNFKKTSKLKQSNNVINKAPSANQQTKGGANV